MRAFLRELATVVRSTIRPWVMELRGAEIVGQSEHGDATFAVDAAAEQAVADFVRSSGRDVAVYSESNGLRYYGESTPGHLIVVDPIDGTRNASCGFEGCMVSVAAAPYKPTVTLGDITEGVLLDIVHDTRYAATRGAGVEVWRDGKKVPLPDPISPRIDHLRWSLNVPGRPIELIVAVMADLINATSLTGSFHASNSTAFSLTRIATGQLHAHVDIADRIYTEFPASVGRFRMAGDTHLTGSQPYDFAACVLVLEEAGGIVTDAWGRSLADVPVLAKGAEAMISVVAARHRDVHAALLAYIASHLHCADGVVRGG